MEVFERLKNVANNISAGPATPLQLHTGMRLRLMVTENKNGREKKIIDKVIVREPMKGSLELHIDGFRLSSGEYVVSIKTLQDNPRLAGVNVALFVGTTWK